MNKSFVIGAAFGLVLGIIFGGFAKAETPIAEPIPAAQVEEVAAPFLAWCLS